MENIFRKKSGSSATIRGIDSDKKYGIDKPEILNLTKTFLNE